MIVDEESICTSPPEIVGLPIVGTDLEFPVRRIYRAGRNYADHAAGVNTRPSEPFYFIKHRDEIIASGSTLLYPPQTRDFQYEVELVVALRSGGQGHIGRTRTRSYIRLRGGPGHDTA